METLCQEAISLFCAEKNCQNKCAMKIILRDFNRVKGFGFRSSDIYGGLAGFWDFGPLGVELFNNINADFWNYFLQNQWQ